MRILGVDFGSRRTGLALSDPHEVTCSPLAVVEEREEARLLQKVEEAAVLYDVEEIVIGIPRPLRGGDNAQSELVQAFADALAARTGVPVRTWDERFTSKMAEAGRSRKLPQDSVAACYMLQSYLDSRANSRGDE